MQHKMLKVVRVAQQTKDSIKTLLWCRPTRPKWIQETFTVCSLVQMEAQLPGISPERTLRKQQLTNS